jgi:hypothetical protein
MELLGMLQKERWQGKKQALSYKISYWELEIKNIMYICTE